MADDARGDVAAGGGAAAPAAGGEPGARDEAARLERAAPLPPRALMIRAGVPDQADALASYRAVGRDSRTTILALLDEVEPGFSLAGRRVLDFGCGAGKVMRHFLPEAARCELWGCDIDGPSVDWINAALSPPLRAFRNREEPPLERPDADFDVVWSVSVFTHLTDHWAGWLAELHRVLRPGGLAVVSFLGGAMYEAMLGEPWEPDRVGMTVLHHGLDWERGGPIVFHSPWWLREHWGRAFEVVLLREGQQPREHGLVVLRRPPGRGVAAAELERVDAGREPRELDALRRQVELLQRETSALRAERDGLRRAADRRLAGRVAGRLRQLRRGR